MGKLIFGTLAIILVAIAGANFFGSLATNNSDMSVNTTLSTFDKTDFMLGLAEDASDEARFLEDVWLIGDIVAMAGNAIKAAQILFSIPEILLNMIGSLFKIFAIPPWIGTVFNTFIWMAIVIIIISILRGFKVG